MDGISHTYAIHPDIAPRMSFSIADGSQVGPTVHDVFAHRSVTTSSEYVNPHSVMAQEKISGGPVRWFQMFT